VRCWQLCGGTTALAGFTAGWSESHRCARGFSSEYILLAYRICQQPCGRAEAMRARTVGPSGIEAGRLGPRP
jgi:hypothetical protein